MCGRYRFGEETAIFIDRSFRAYNSISSVGDITPGMSPIVLSGREQTVKAENMLWGMENKGSLIINARAESVHEKPMFASSVKSRRIIIPAQYFYEWDRDKNKVSFALPESNIIYLAGFYNMVNNRDAFVILTTAANESMERVHDRMPLIIGENDIDDWIYESGKTDEFLHGTMPQLRSWQDYEQLSFA